jgi:NAD(P)-dependent dehydrogenase (short-subunit alcohol dehydrogenase family)
MDLELKGKVALVTGAAQGIGYAIAERFIREGASVAMCDLRPDAVEVAAKELSSAGTTFPLTMDVRDLASVRAAFDATLEEFGAIDVCVNNAGDWVDKPFLETTEDDWTHDLAVNLSGAINCTHAAISAMHPAGGGSIVSIVSEAGRVGEPRGATYSAAKAGVIALTKALAKEFGGSNIRLNCVALGATRTPRLERVASDEIQEKMAKRYPLRRLGTPEDAADLVAYLSSARAGWITGQTYGVNGGYAMA